MIFCHAFKKISFSFQRAKEEALQKETKVKLLTETVNSVIAQAPPAAQAALKKELETLTANYQWLCTRLNGKCKTLEVSYLSFFLSVLCQMDSKNLGFAVKTFKLEFSSKHLQHV